MNSCIPVTEDKFQAANVRVFISGEATVEKTVTAFKTGMLSEAMPATACGHHGHGPHGHGHGAPGPHGTCGGQS